MTTSPTYRIIDETGSPTADLLRTWQQAANRADWLTKTTRRLHRVAAR